MLKCPSILSWQNDLQSGHAKLAFNVVMVKCSSMLSWQNDLQSGHRKMTFNLFMVKQPLHLS